MSWSLGELWDERRVSAALFAAGMLVPLVGLGLGAVDIARYSAAQSELRMALVTGSERVGPEVSRDEQQTLIRDHVISSVGGSIDKGSIAIEMPITQPDGVGLVVEARMRTRFLYLIGIDTLRLREELPAESPTQVMLGLMLAACGRMNRDELNSAVEWRAV